MNLKVICGTRQPFSYPHRGMNTVLKHGRISYPPGSTQGGGMDRKAVQRCVPKDAGGMPVTKCTDVPEWNNMRSVLRQSTRNKLRGEKQKVETIGDGLGASTCSSSPGTVTESHSSSSPSSSSSSSPSSSHSQFHFHSHSHCRSHSLFRSHTHTHPHLLPFAHKEMLYIRHSAGPQQHTRAVGT